MMASTCKRSPTVKWPAAPDCPPIVTRFPISTEPAIPTWATNMQSSPILVPWPTTTELLNLVPRPIRVTPSVARSIAQTAPTDEALEAKASIFDRVRDWVGAGSRRVASWLEPTTTPHRRLPDTIDLPAEVSDAARSDLEQVLSRIAADVCHPDDGDEAAELSEAVDEIFQDWLF